VDEPRSRYFVAEWPFCGLPKGHDIWRSPDPLNRWRISYAKNISFEDAMMEFEGMPKSAIPLSIIKRRAYSLAIVLNTASNRILVLDTQGGKNSDTFFKQFTWDTIPRNFKLHGMWYGEKNQYAQLAPYFLRGIILKTAQMETGYLPGSVRTDEHYSPELSPPRWESWIRDLYFDSKWPDFVHHRVEEFMFPSSNNTWIAADPFQKFREMAFHFDYMMKGVKHDILVKYLPDWYCPLPREEHYVSQLEAMGKLTPEQSDYARSDEEIITMNLKTTSYLVSSQWWDEKFPNPNFVKLK